MVSAIIVAAGSGKRMKEKTRKQYLYLQDRPILVHTLIAINSCPSIKKICLVVPEEDMGFCRKNILIGTISARKVQLVSGGDTRQASVYNGIQATEDKKGIIVIHDGVRPFVRPEQIEMCIEQAYKWGACIVGVPAYDTLKNVDSRKVITDTVERNTIWHSQTPQAFRFDLIKEAHDIAIKDGYIGSDDALLVERLGQKVRVVTGSKYNIKITTEEDLLIAGAILDSGLI